MLGANKSALEKLEKFQRLVLRRLLRLNCFVDPLQLHCIQILDLRRKCVSMTLAFMPPSNQDF